MANFTIPIVDYANQESSARLPVLDAITDIELSAVFVAVDDISLGNVGQSSLDLATPKDAGPGGAPGNKAAQRELKWLAKYHDAVTLDEHEMEIPTADYSLISGNTTFMDTGAGAGATFKTAFEAHVIAPVTGNAVLLDSAQLIGSPI